MKQQLQGIVTGFLVALLVLSTANVLAITTRTIEITYGVNVVVDGIPQHFQEDSIPFQSDGRTFLSVRGIAESLGLDVSWDGATSTVFISSSAPIISAPTPSPIPTPTPVPTPEPTPMPPRIVYLEIGISGELINLHSHPDAGTFTMPGGVGTSRSGVVFTSGISNSSGEIGIVRYDISGEGFARLTGTLGMTSWSGTHRPASLLILGDSVPLGTFSHAGGVGSSNQSIDIIIPEGTQILEIRMQPHSSGAFGLNSLQIGFGDAKFSTE
ncbi:MAG: copper amine oxidase N-terminal domain-containing protein [Defluviitaleaceae bacterium]|nr:copper amine oxidase N-terminal domain-containing protein [Defluviitaleaceae bacterium]